MRVTLLKLLLFGIVFSLPSVVVRQSEPTDLVLFNGKIFTSNTIQPYVEALAIRGDRIVAVGTSKEILALAGTDTKRIDAGGRTVIPGINDAHVHLSVSPDAYDLPVESRDPSWQEIKE